MIEKNPDFFQTIVKEVQEKVQGGMDQANAMMLVMKKYESELKTMVGKN